MRESVHEVLNKPLSQELMQSSIPARLAYVGLDAAPRVVPVGFLWNGTEMIVCTVPTSAKVAALQANPKVAVTIDTEGFPPHALLVRGEARVELVEGVPDDYVTAARKVVPAEQFDGWLASVRGLYEQMSRISIAPTWAKLLDFETTLPKSVEELVRARQQ